MTEAEESIRKDYCEYVVSENDFKLCKEPGSTKETRFGNVEIVSKIEHRDEVGDVVTDDKFVRIELSNQANEAHVFAQQIDLFVQTEIHPAIVQFEGFEFLPRHRAITKYYPHRSLQHILQNQARYPQWNGTMKSKCVFGIVAAMTHLHNIYDDTIPDFAIRYLHPENVMFDELDQVRIINYVYGDENIPTPAAYIPPELHENPNAEHYDQDIWCFGMILYEILTGHAPFAGLSDDQIKRKIIAGEIPPLPDPSPDTDYICGMIQNCLAKKPTDRPLFYHVFHFLDNLTEPLFPGTDRTYYDNYKMNVLPKTVQNEESIEYMKKPAAKPSSGGETLEQMAERGDPNALVRIGRFYQKGLNGYPLDEAKGLEYFQQAAEKNYPIAMYNTALCLLQGRGTPHHRKDPKAAFEMIKKAVPISDSYPIVLSQYGEMLLEGIGCTKQPTEALKIFQKGDSLNDGYSQYLLASLYSEGAPGIPKDMDKALLLYDKSARNGCSQADHDKAFYFKDIDLPKAINLFKKAANQKNVDALLNLGKIYSLNRYHMVDYAQALSYYKQGADLKDPLCTTEYAKCILKGQGCVVQLKRAADLFKAAIDYDRSGSLTIIAKFEYARMLFEGEGIAQNIKTSVPYFKEVADAEADLLDSTEKKNAHMKAMYYYGKILIQGLGGERVNAAEGKRYMKEYLRLARSKRNYHIEDDAAKLAE